MSSSTGGAVPLPPPDWYPDPANTLRQRWWDGSRWSQSTRELPPPAPATSPAHARLERLRDLNVPATETADGRPLAGLATRGFAYAFDFLICSTLASLAQYLITRLTRIGPDLEQFERMSSGSAPLAEQSAFLAAHPVVYAVAFLPVAVTLVYFVLFYAVLRATPGQLANQIRPVPVAGGKRLGLGAALVRGLWFGLLSWPIPVLPIIGGLRAQPDARRQGWHDKLAHSQVISTRVRDTDA